MKRVVSGLEWARAVAEGPFGVSRPRKPAKKAGLKYEREVEKALLDVGKRGQWFQFKDQNGPGWCQTDYLVRTPGLVLVLEMKLTWTPGAVWEIEGLYRPVVEMAFGTPVVGLVVCKNLVRGVSGVTTSLGEAVRKAREGQRPILYWRGEKCSPPLLTRGAGEGPGVLEFPC